MKKLILASIVTVVGALLFLIEFNGIDKVNYKESSQSLQQPLSANYVRLPMHFEPNQGQVAEEVEFVSRGKGYTLFLTSGEAVLSLRKPEVEDRDEDRDSEPKLSREKITSENPKSEIFTALDNSVSNGAGPKSTTLRMQLVGANPKPEVEGLDELPGKSNYFIGNDPERWRTNVPNYAKVQYEGVYPGIDLVYYGNQSRLEYDFVVSPGAELNAITLGFEGAADIRIDEDGNLVLLVDGGEVTMRAPVIYQETELGKEGVSGNFEFRGNDRVGFDVDAYDAGIPLVIDPELVYSTYLGGTSRDEGNGIAVDAAGSAYVTGTTFSDDFPTANAFQGTPGRSFPDAFVTKLSPDGSSLVYSTYLGGIGDDRGNGIAVDAAGSAYVTGTTFSVDFPTENPFQGSLRSFPDAFVTKLSPDGSSLDYSTYLGGRIRDMGKAIAVDAAGSAYVTGKTVSDDFPTENAFQGSQGGLDDAFVTKLSVDGASLVYSTYLGGERDDEGNGIAVDAAGSAYVTGGTVSDDDPNTPDNEGFPTANPFQGTPGGRGDAFVTKVSPGGASLVYSTYLGGANGDEGFGIAVDAAGAYVTGETASDDFPTENPFQGMRSGGSFIPDAFVTKLGVDGDLLVYSTYLGGTNSDGGFGIALDAAGSAFVTGETFSDEFPTANASQGTLGGIEDAFVTKFNAAGDSPIYSTYLGGANDDEGRGIAVDAAGSAYVTGLTTSDDFATANPFQGTRGGDRDAFVAKIGAKKDTLIYNEVTYGQPLVFSREPTSPQHILPQYLIKDVKDTVYFHFEGRSTDGKVGLRVQNTRVSDPPSAPLELKVKILDPDDTELVPFSIPFTRVGDVGEQFNVVIDGIYEVRVYVDSNSPGPLPAPFQIHIAANAGLPSVRDFPRAIRQDILLNHSAPRPQGLFGKDSSTAQTALFKFVKRSEVSQFANAVIVPPPGSSAGFPIGQGIVRAPDPMKPLHKTTPTARTPVCDGLDPTGMVVDFTQIPDPAVPGLVLPSLSGTVCAVIGENDATSVTLPLENGVTSLILDTGSGQEIVDVPGADFMVFSSDGNYTVAVGNTPFSGSFVPVGGTVSGTQSFDLAGTSLTSARFVMVTAAPEVTLDALKALNVFIDEVVMDPVTGSDIPVERIDHATITMRRAKATETDIDPFLQLIAPDGTNFGKDDSGFKDKTTVLVTDAALKHIDLSQQGFYRFLARGYDVVPDAQAFGAFFVRLESTGERGVYDETDIIVSAEDEDNTSAQKMGSISTRRERDSYLFQWHPGQPIRIVVNATAGNLDPVLELHDPEGFLIAANDNYSGRGRNAALALTLPANSFNAEAVSPELPDPSTYRLIVSAVDTIFGPQNRHDLTMGTAYFRDAASGDYVVKVFTGALAGAGAIMPALVSVSPNIAVQGATDLEILINGSNFVNGATVTITGFGIAMKSVNFINANQLRVTIDIEQNAATGFRDVIVTNPGGKSDTRLNSFEIRENLGSINLTWDPPSSGQSLAAPTNLSAQFSGSSSLKMANASSALDRHEKQAQKLRRRKNDQKNKSGGRKITKSGSTLSKLQMSQQPEELSNEVPVTRTIAQDEIQEFFITVAQDASSLVFTTSNSTGDPDLFVRFGAPPDLVNTVFDFSSENSLPDEEAIAVSQLTFPVLQAGDWFVTVLGFEQSTYTLTATYTEPEELTNGTPVTKIITEVEVQEFFINIPQDATTLTFQTSNSSGDPDIFARFGAPPDFINDKYDFFSETIGAGEESITIDQATNPQIQAGNWYLSVLEFDFGQQSYTLTATHDGTGGGVQLSSYNIYRSTSANARSTGTLVGNIDPSVTTFTDPVPSTGTFFYQVTAVYDQGESAPSNDASVLVTSVEERRAGNIPVNFALKQNYPNPFNPETKILYDLPRSTHLRIDIFNLLGQKIKTLVDESKPAGSYTIVWDGRTDRGDLAASGVYVYRLQTEQFEKSRKLLLLR